VWHAVESPSHLTDAGRRRGNFDGGVFLKQRDRGATVMALDAFGFRDRRAQADSEIVGEMVAADGNRSSVSNYAAAVNDKLGGAAADVEQTGAEIAFVLGEASFRGGKRLDDGVTTNSSTAVTIFGDDRE
jgi:hypothetical protein